MRPSIDLTKIKFPFTAIVSILHRICGVLLILGLVASPYIFLVAKQNPSSFYKVITFLNNNFIRFIFWGFASLSIYHINFGIRHIIMDIGYWQDMKKANYSAVIFFLLTLFLVIFLAYRLFL